MQIVANVWGCRCLQMQMFSDVLVEASLQMQMFADVRVLQMFTSKHADVYRNCREFLQFDRIH